MRIAVISPIWLRTPPPRYGAVERIAGVLADGLAARGHEVTLYATGDSITTARLRSHYEKAPTAEDEVGELHELNHVLTAYREMAEYDVVHDHTDPIGPAMGAVAASIRPVVHTVHGDPGVPDTAALYRMIDDRVRLVAVSAAQRARAPSLRYADVIHHGLPMADFPYGDEGSDYALFVGRMHPSKGLHYAITAARSAGLALVVACKEIERESESRYFRESVQPLLGDDVTLVGEADFAAKTELYRRARCTIVPTNWPEPFGLTVVESLACGTPVIALRRGATAELVDDGVTGYLADEPDELGELVRRSEKLERAACRATAESRFSAERMVTDYEHLYERLTGH